MEEVIVPVARWSLTACVWLAGWACSRWSQEYCVCATMGAGGQCVGTVEDTMEEMV